MKALQRERSRRGRSSARGATARAATPPGAETSVRSSGGTQRRGGVPGYRVGCSGMRRRGRAGDNGSRRSSGSCASTACPRRCETRSRSSSVPANAAGSSMCSSYGSTITFGRRTGLVVVDRGVVIPPILDVACAEVERGHASEAQAPALPEVLGVRPTRDRGVASSHDQRSWHRRRARGATSDPRRRSAVGRCVSSSG